MSGSKVRAVAVGPASCGLYSANLTPGHRRCRRSPADATEGNEPKTDRIGAKPSGAGPATRRVRPPVRRLAARQSRGCALWAGGCGPARQPQPIHPAWQVCRVRPAQGSWSPSSIPPASSKLTSGAVALCCTRVCCRPTDYRPAARASPAAASTSLCLRALRLLFFRSVFGSFPSVASAGLCLQCRFSGVKFALYVAATSTPDRSARTLLPGFGAVPLGADDATEGNEPHHLTNRQRRALRRPPYGTAPVPRGSQEPPPEAPAVDFRHPPHAAIAANTTRAQ